VHSSIDLEVRRAEVFALIGGSGSGKSTLLREMILLQRPSSGTIRVLGVDLQDIGADDALALSQRWGVMFQHVGLFGSLTVKENVGLPLREHSRLDDTLIDEIVAWKLALTGLRPEVGAQYPSELSGGMMTRASLARALALDPELLFLDEPTAGLDPDSAGGVDQLVHKLRDLFGLTIVIITHDLDLLWQVTDRVAVLGEGQVQGIGSMAELSQMVRPRSACSSTGRAGGRRSNGRETCLKNHPREATMETKVNYPLVGAFVLVLGVALVAAVLWLAAGGAFRQSHELYRAIVNESVAGLNLNAAVKYNGVDVGKVGKIQLDSSNPEQVHLLFEIEQGTPIREDTVAVLKIQGLTGIAYIELSGGSPDSPLLRASDGGDHPLIRTRPSLSARLENVLTTALGKVDRLSNTLNSLLSDENRAAFASTLADIAIVAQTLADRKNALDSGIAHAARTFEHTSRASAQIGPVLDRIGRSADAIDQMGQAVARTSASTGKTVDAVGADLQHFGSDTLPELERLMEELRLLSTSLRRLAEQTERNPAGLLFGRQPVPEGPGESSSTGERQP
jgi:phospholipid/cholesterol/gamma-HCH transport system substrate-binding protein